MAETIRVLVADDHPLMRTGIRTILSTEEDLTVVGEAADADEVQKLCLELKPDVLLLDLSMPGPVPVQTVTFLRDHAPDVKVIVLTAYDSDAYIRGVVALGVAGYVLKDETADVIVQAVRTVCRGGTWFSQSVAEKTAEMLALDNTQAGLSNLSYRELQVLRYVVAGLANKEIAARMGISEKTVEFHITNIKEKIGGSSRVGLAMWGKANGLTS